MKKRNGMLAICLLLIVYLMSKKYKITFHFLWFDMWMGLYIDTKTGVYYFCPLPMAVFKFSPKGERCTKNS